MVLPRRAFRDGETQVTKNEPETLAQIIVGKIYLDSETAVY